MMRRLRVDAVQRDAAKAAISVATARPTMATARYAHAKCTAGSSCGEVTRRVSVRPTGEGTEVGTNASEDALLTPATNETAKHPTATTDEVAATATITATTTTTLATTCTVASGTEAEAAAVNENNDVDGTKDERIAAIRIARRVARKQAKRQQVKRALARRRERVQAETLARRCCMEMELEERRQKADQALHKLEQRRSLRRDEPSRVDGDRMRVSLVQRQYDHDDGRVCVGKDVVECIEADDGLPTATVLVSNERKCIKSDSCAGPEWVRYGDRISRDAPVDFVEGVGGFTLDVIGAWHLAFRSVFNELIEIDACIVSGCTSEFLVGVDLMKAHGAIMDFHTSEVRYR
ncbi:unnamed protein product [Phytophthora fragariaefolia]|uniref:Unnamed protein product n=1 Tax=Phytophthora fragariaefolia TaxID=1490495 RepID=A0A9W6TVE5_9STRA|nr:unnamed protein product [Phytophthora fragariaefolia]